MNKIKTYQVHNNSSDDETVLHELSWTRYQLNNFSHKFYKK